MVCHCPAMAELHLAKFTLEWFAILWMVVFLVLESCLCSGEAFLTLGAVEQPCQNSCWVTPGTLLQHWRIEFPFYMVIDLIENEVQIALYVFIIVCVLTWCKRSCCERFVENPQRSQVKSWVLSWNWWFLQRLYALPKLPPHSLHACCVLFFWTDSLCFSCMWFNRFCFTL